MFVPNEHPYLQEEVKAILASMPCAFYANLTLTQLAILKWVHIVDVSEFAHNAQEK